MTLPKKPTRKVDSCLLVVALLVFPIVSMVFSFGWWSQFHPANTTEAVDGPAGSSNRAYFDTNSFTDPVFELHAADWPYTLSQPFCVGDSFRKYGGWGAFHWSGDGSLAVMTYQDDELSLPYLAAAYDYREHQGYELLIKTTELEKLVKARGRLGPRMECR